VNATHIAKTAQGCIGSSSSSGFVIVEGKFKRRLNALPLASTLLFVAFFPVAIFAFENIPYPGLAFPDKQRRL
jgi:hypothetical protein